MKKNFLHGFQMNEMFILIPTVCGEYQKCTSELFYDTCMSPDVARLELMRFDSKDLSNEDFVKLHFKQPRFLFCKTLIDESTQWNGMVLCCVENSYEAHQILARHANELNVRLSFDDPDTDRLFFLVDSGKRIGNKKHDEYDVMHLFSRTRLAVMEKVRRYLPQAVCFSPDYITMAYHIDHYQFYPVEEIHHSCTRSQGYYESIRRFFAKL